ncbi:MAG: hypothetical protein II707_01950, partial [Spirochaetales bacterium]|nr:hypothetical protein [Spirochaetales bacterium]
MKKTKLLWILCTIVLLLVGCPTEQSDSKSDDSQTSPSSGTGNPTKITGFANLQEVIDNDDTKAGAVIDLSDYANIEGFSYSAKIDKAVILKNTKNTALKGAALTVVTDGVVMSGIKNASVSTNSSLKISSSTLSSLSIVNTASSSPSSNQVSGRGDTSAAAVSKPPIVEVDHTEVAEDVSVAIENAYLNVENFTAKKAVSLDAANVQLTINDNTDTNIKQITTDQICQVVLVAGTSDTIPTPNVTGDGELKQINVAAAGNMELLALTPMSGLTSIVKQGESIDFSTVVVLGTYQANDGITIFKAGLSYELKETFSKLEKNYIVKIGSAKVFENGNNLSYNWAGLEAGTYNAEIDIDYSYPAETYQSYKFKIAVIGKTESQTEIIIPTFSLTELKAEKGGARTDYIAGDKLNLAGLMVFGTYTATVGDVTYSSIVTDYTLNPPNGSVLTADITSVTVSSENKTVSVPINVRALVNVTFIMDASNDIKAVQKLAAGEKVSMPNDPSRRGYIFSG